VVLAAAVQTAAVWSKLLHRGICSPSEPELVRLEAPESIVVPAVAVAAESAEVSVESLEAAMETVPVGPRVFLWFQTPCKQQ
jgi:hypothetical protein